MGKLTKIDEKDEIRFGRRKFFFFGSMFLAKPLEVVKPEPEVRFSPGYHDCEMAWLGIGESERRPAKSEAGFQSLAARYNATRQRPAMTYCPRTGRACPVGEHYGIVDRGGASFYVTPHGLRPWSPA